MHKWTINRAYVVQTLCNRTSTLHGYKQITQTQPSQDSVPLTTHSGVGLFCRAMHAGPPPHKLSFLLSLLILKIGLLYCTKSFCTVLLTDASWVWVLTCTVLHWSAFLFWVVRMHWHCQLGCACTDDPSSSGNETSPILFSWKNFLVKGKAMLKH